MDVIFTCDCTSIDCAAHHADELTYGPVGNTPDLSDADYGFDTCDGTDHDCGEDAGEPEIEEPDSPRVEAMVNADQDRRPTYAWWVGDRITAGTLTDYAGWREHNSGPTVEGGFIFYGTPVELANEVVGMWTDEGITQTTVYLVETHRMGRAGDYAYNRLVIRSSETEQIIDAADYKVNLLA